MHTEPLYALALFHQRQAEERARIYRLAKQARIARRADAAAPQRIGRRRMRRLRPVGDAA